VRFMVRHEDERVAEVKGLGAERLAPTRNVHAHRYANPPRSLTRRMHHNIKRTNLPRSGSVRLCRILAGALASIAMSTEDSRRRRSSAPAAAVERVDRR
jgi:hypothetical protein